LQANSSGSYVIIKYFGAVGATKYRIFRSLDAKTYTLLADNLMEEESIEYTDRSNEYSNFNCSTPVYYRMESIREDSELVSEPIDFKVIVWIDNEPEYCKPKKSTSDSNPKSLDISLIIALTVSAVLVVGSSITLLTIYYRRIQKMNQMMELAANAPTSLSRINIQECASETYALGKKSKNIK
jgi:hypothetical protein